MENKSRKKKIIAFAFGAAVALALVFGISILMRGNNMYQLALNNIAEARFFMRKGETTQMNVQFSSGMREEPYNQNGLAERNVPFALINIEPRGDGLAAYTELTGVIRIGGQDTNVTIERNEFNRHNFATDLGTLVDKNLDVVLIINLSTGDVTIPLRPAMDEEAITWERALEIAVEELDEHWGEFGRQFEVYIKIVTDRNHQAAFWYVQFLNRSEGTLFVLMGQDGQVIGMSRQIGDAV